MSSASKFLALTLSILLLSSLFVLTVTSTAIQATSELSVPQFSVKFIDKSYDVPPTRTTDPYTGKTITELGYHVNDGWLEVTVRNQPFTPYTVGGSNRRDLYYYVEVKGHFGGDNDWYSLYPSGTETGYVQQSDSDYTVLTNYSAWYDSGTKLDFRVRAVVGYPWRVTLGWYMFVEEESDWSSVQTITITYGSSPSSPSQTTTPDNNNNQPQQSNHNQPASFVLHPTFLFWFGTLLFTGIVIAAILLFLKRHLKPKSIVTTSSANIYAFKLAL